MKLDEIKKIISRLPEGSDFVLDKDSFHHLDILEPFLARTFRTEALRLGNLSKDPGNATLRGTASNVRFMDKIHETLVLRLSFSEAGNVLFLLADLEIADFQPFQEVSPDFPVICQGFQVQIYTPDKGACLKEHSPACPAAPLQPYIRPVISAGGRLRLCSGDFWPVTLVSVVDGRWSLMSGRPEPDTPGPKQDLLSLLKLLGVDSMASLLPQELLAVVKNVYWESLNFSFELKGKGITSFDTVLSVGRDRTWAPLPFLVIDGLSLEIHLSFYRWDHKPDITATFNLKGNISLCNHRAPAAVSVSSCHKNLCLLLGGREPIELGSIGELASFIGDVDIGELLPQGYEYGKLYLHELYLSLSAGDKIKMDGFSVFLEMANVLQIPGWFAVRKIFLEYRGMGDERMIRLSGSLEFSGLGFDVEMKKINQSWSFRACVLEDAFVTLADICRALGMGDISLPDSLNLGIGSLCFTYDFGSKEMTLDAWTDRGGRACFKARWKEDGAILAFGLRLEMDLGLDGLPVIGQSVELLNQARIGNLRLVAVSADTQGLTLEGIIENMTLKKGIYLIPDFTLMDQAYTMVLPLYTEDSGPGGFQAPSGFLVPDRFLVPALPLALDNPPVSGGKRKGISLDLNKHIGPVQLKTVYVSFYDGIISFGLDAGFAADLLEFGLTGLALSYDLESRQPGFFLSGLSVGVHSGSLQVQGSFIRSGEDTYKGGLVLGMGGVSVTAVGAYTCMEGMPSVFTFALLRASIGGPPCFFITGIAAAFGYNRILKIPSLDQLDQDPLMKAAAGQMDPGELLRHELELFPPAAGQGWAAAGLIFHSFELIESTALLTVSFGSCFEMHLLGRSVLNAPPKAQSAPLAHAVLLLDVSFLPEAYLVRAQAALSGESYILSKDCHLSGGFAFYMWYGGEHSGDFVVTLGGYRDRYQKPSHYPEVSRLALNWQVTDALSVRGAMYFALTPSCLMAGGSLKLVYSSGIIRAWFNAWVDLYLRWKPFGYELGMGICIGVSVDLWLFTIRLELSCDLRIWGPEFSGTAHVKLWCISFSISFGSSPAPEQKPISIEEFVSSFFRKKDSALSGAVEYAICSIRIQKGLHKEYENAHKEKVWSVCGENLRISLQSAVPLYECSFNGNVFRPQASYDYFLRPCEAAMAHSGLKVWLVREDGGEIKDRLVPVPIFGRAPAALWGRKEDTGETVPALLGITIQAPVPDYYSVEFGLDYLGYGYTVPLEPLPSLRSIAYEQEKAYEYISTIRSDHVLARRRRLAGGFLDIRLSDMGELAGNPAGVFCEKPFIIRTGADADGSSERWR